MLLSLTPTHPPSGYYGPEKTRRGFSLVEVAIALGIVSFVLVALLGLLSTGMTAGKQSAEDVVVAVMAKTVFSDLRTNSYASLQNYSNSRYFQYAGGEVSTSNGAYFVCQVKTAAHASDPLSGLTDAGNAVRVTLNFSWPVGAATSNEEVFETTLARY